ncbi:nucleoid-associated protein [Bacillus cereus]|uniref:nucleoid-associated protein n=1 Tax=Bacillus cereus TaxID=1396 RepID=UPI002AC0E58E|nr:nucleoid-associated protein [Bacillus cereus]MDZ4621181.1 nucleoid-associated protein [Bacillus cereus]
MIDFTRIKIDKMIIHYVGNKLKNEGLKISNGEAKNISSELNEVLLKYFLSSFKYDSILKFTHQTNLELNEIYHYISTIFRDKETLYEQSINILKHLYEKSTHPNIKCGELYIVYFLDCLFEGEILDAVGIFKSENKDIYLKTSNHEHAVEMNFEKGINIKNLDKGCIIFNTKKEEGYKVTVVDKTSSSEAMYWKEQFLKLENYKDENYQTINYMNVCNEFIKNIDTEIVPVDSTQKIELLNRTLDYFSDNEHFNFDTFAKEVIKQPDKIEKFKSYRENYERDNNVELSDDFNISNQALKKVKSKIKNLIKLDNNIEIKFNQNTVKEHTLENIEKGYDHQKGMYFYKIYYNEEKGM